MSEIRALLLTDVVDSTKLSEQLGDGATAALWAAHDRMARDLLPAWRGREIDKTDGMLLMFDAAADALGYARAYLQGLATLPVALQARAGLHVGAVILRQNSAEDVARGAKPLEVDGLAKPTAARVMSLAAGGQILLTPEARAGLPDAGAVTRSLGHWMMKGLSEPVELFEPGAPDQAGNPPPDSEKVWRVVKAGERWVPVREIPNNLPQQLTSFVGRERELAEVRALMAHTRLLMLLGMGGLGKTRLSLQVAAEVMHDFPDGVWFVDLAPIRDGALVVHEAARVLGVSEEPGTPLLQTLCSHLKSRRVLFIVDNCEHLLQPAAEVANAVLRAAPQVRILASSRELLHVPGEQAYAVLPLPLPERDAGVEGLLRSTAVRLFVDRARTHRPAFAVTEREAPALAELVSRLEGIPLALELAAARVRTLTVPEINVRLKDRYRLLTGGGRVLLERQQTLQALVDWSYELLGEPERQLLARLSVFAGGFSLAAVEAVCGHEPLHPDDMLDLLGSLADKSLLMAEERDEGMRYRMLETIRDYATLKLRLAGEAAEVAARHCEHFFAFAKAARDGLKGPEQAQWIARVETDLDNLRAALALALKGGTDPFIAVKLAVAMQRFWILRGYCTEGRSAVAAALAMPAIQASDLAQAHALYVGAALAQSQSDHVPARQMLEQCLALRRPLGDRFSIAATLSTLSLARLAAGDIAGAREGEQEALRLFREIGERVGEAIALLHLGQISLFAGDDADAAAQLQASLALAQQVGYHGVQGECEMGLGQLAYFGGELDAAGQRLARAGTICHEDGDKRGQAQALGWLGKVELAQGRLEPAGARLAEALREFRASEMREDLRAGLEDHAELAWALGATELAVRLQAAVAAAHARLGVARAPRLEARWQALLRKVREGTPPSAYATAWQEGGRWDLAEAVRQALMLEPPASPGASVINAA